MEQQRNVFDEAMAAMGRLVEYRNAGTINAVNGWKELGIVQRLVNALREFGRNDFADELQTVFNAVYRDRCMLN